MSLEQGNVTWPQLEVPSKSEMDISVLTLGWSHMEINCMGIISQGLTKGKKKKKKRAFLVGEQDVV